MYSALMIVDMQMLMQDRIDDGREHINPGAPDKIAAMTAAFRAAGKTVVHVRHQDDDFASPLHPRAPGYQAMPCAREVASERIFIKRSSSAFATTDLAKYLTVNGISSLFVTGAVAGFCINSTVRAGSDQGFRMIVIRDAVIEFDLPSANLDARTIFDVTMGLLETDFAEMTDSNSVITGLRSGVAYCSGGRLLNDRFHPELGIVRSRHTHCAGRNARCSRPH